MSVPGYREADADEVRSAEGLLEGGQGDVMMVNIKYNNQCVRSHSRTRGCGHGMH